LEQHPNPFGLIVLAHLQSLETKGLLSERKDWKFRLTRGLLNRGLDEKQIRQIYRIIDWFLELPQVLETELRIQIRDYEKENTVPYLSTFERMGREEGIAIGERNELMNTLKMLLQWKFFESGQAFWEEIKTIQELDKLRAIQKAILYATSLEDLRRLK
jgi:hypothetical protein